MEKHEYESIQGLPDYDDLDNEFEISRIEETRHLIREIRRKMISKIDHIIEFLESILQPDPGKFIDVHEYRTFNEAERKEIFNILREFVMLHRLSAEAEIKADDEFNKEVIKELNEQWKNHKAKVVEIMRKLKENWKKDFIAKEILEYFG